MDRLEPPERRDVAILTPISDWSSRRGTQFVLWLLDAGVDVNTRFTPAGSEEETTVLHVATWGCDAAFVAELVARGAAVDALMSMY